MKDRDFFFTTEPIFKIVNKKEFFNYIKHYPRVLEIDVCGIADPPAVSYNDFNLANRWPYSVVASYTAFSDDPNDHFYGTEEEKKYRIMINYEEVYNSKTGNMAKDSE